MKLGKPLISSPWSSDFLFDMIRGDVVSKRCVIATLDSMIAQLESGSTYRVQGFRSGNEFGYTSSYAHEESRNRTYFTQEERDHYLALDVLSAYQAMISLRETETTGTVCRLVWCVDVKEEILSF